jgi:hypothetical protein
MNGMGGRNGAMSPEFESLIRRLETIHQLPPGGRE